MTTIHSSKLLKLALAASLMLSMGACDKFGKKKDAYAGTTDADYVNGSPLPDRTEGTSFTSSNVDRSRFKPVHFSYDSYAIEPNETAELDAVADFLKGGSNSIIVAGFTDERGTAEYNRGLGERRAAAVRQYLIQHGANGAKIQTVSFGADLPADPASNEAAWAKNRRAEFGVVR